MARIHFLKQGSKEWHAHRETPNQINGSELAAIMGLSRYVSRAEMVRRKATGIKPEYDAATLARFAEGHDAEELARPIAEEIIGDDLSPLVMSDTIDGVLLSVSLDGVTQDFETTFEHKLLNASLAEALDAGYLPEEYHPQCEAGLMVSGATRCLFMASRGGDPTTARHYWYESQPELRRRIIAVCKQFLDDVANYVHAEAEPALIAADIKSLPALFVQVEGRVIASNLDAFQSAARTFLNSVKDDLVTDQDFADAEKMVKFLKDGEEKLEYAKHQALEQTASIYKLFSAIDTIKEQMRAKRLALDKLVKHEKYRRKHDLIEESKAKFDAHVRALSESLGAELFTQTNVRSRFAEAIKGLKSIDSMRDRLDLALAEAKIEATESARTIRDILQPAVTDQHAKHTEATHVEPSETAMPEEQLAGSQPIKVDEALIDDFLSVLEIGANERMEIRPILVEFEMFRIKRSIFGCAKGVAHG
jgi:putative phage-type endonuclease